MKIVRPETSAIQTKFLTTRQELSAALIERDDEIDLVLTALVGNEHPLLVGCSSVMPVCSLFGNKEDQFLFQALPLFGQVAAASAKLRMRIDGLSSDKSNGAPMAVAQTT